MNTLIQTLFGSWSATLITLSLTLLLIYGCILLRRRYQPLPKVTEPQNTPHTTPPIPATPSKEAGIHRAAEIIRDHARKADTPERRDAYLKMAERLEKDTGTARHKRSAFLDQLEAEAKENASQLDMPNSPDQDRETPDVPTAPQEPSAPARLEPSEGLRRLIAIHEKRLEVLQLEIRQMDPLNTSTADLYLERIQIQTDIENKIAELKARLDNLERPVIVPF